MNPYLRKIILAFFLTILIIVGIMYYRLAPYKEVFISEIKNKEFHMVYVDHVGPYHKIVKSIEKVEAWAKKHAIPCDLSFGEYLDNPDQVPEDRLRSRAGCLLNSESVLKLSDGMKFKINSPQDFVLAEFSGSPAVGPFVVYPKVKEWFQKNKKQIGSPIIEVYEISNGRSEIKTYYYFPYGS